MFKLIKYDNYNFKIKKKLEELNITPVFLFNLEITKNKNYNSKNYQEILDIIKKDNLEDKYLAIKIILKALDSSTIGFVNSLKKKFDIVIGFGGLNRINRFFLEETNIDFLQDPHNSYYNVKFDFIHHPNSGLNHILCKFAENKNIGFIYSLNFLLNTNRENKNNLNNLKEISRINQNISFNRKYNNSVIFDIRIHNVNQIKTEIELKQISEIFNLSNIQRTEMIDALENKIIENRKKKSSEFITYGIEKIN